MGSVERPLADRFWPKVDKRGPDECWPWLAGSDRRGYGVMEYKYRQIRATHASLMIAGRPLPPGLFACHHCDNPPCVNPAHLFAGTSRDNMRDGVAKGRPIGQYVRTPEMMARRFRAPTCTSGHPFDEANTGRTKQGWRYCQTCNRERARRAHARGSRSSDSAA